MLSPKYIDGSSKGGIVLNWVRTCRSAIYFIGLGEQRQDVEICDSKNTLMHYVQWK